MSMPSSVLFFHKIYVSRPLGCFLPYKFTLDTRCGQVPKVPEFFINKMEDVDARDDGNFYWMAHEIGSRVQTRRNEKIK